MGGFEFNQILLHPTVWCADNIESQWPTLNPPGQLSILTNFGKEITDGKQAKEVNQSKSWPTVNFTKQKQQENAGFSRKLLYQL